MFKIRVTQTKRFQWDNNDWLMAIPPWARLISSKQGWAWLVLGWETAWEYQVLFFLWAAVAQEVEWVVH